MQPRTDVNGDPEPTPRTHYYTKEQVDALVSSLEVGITSVNGQTGEVELDAEDVGAVAAGGRVIEALEVSAGTVTVPASDAKVYTYTLSAGDVVAISAPAEGRMPIVWLLLTVPAGAPSFAFNPAPLWPDYDGKFASGNSAPDFDPGTYLLVFLKIGNNLCCNVAARKGL